MNSIDEFSLFDKQDNADNVKYQSKQKNNLDNFYQNINNINLFSTNDNTIRDSLKKKDNNSGKEVTPFSLYDNKKPLNRKLNFLDEDEPMDTEEFQDNNSSMSDSPIKEKEKEKNNNNKNTKSEEEFEEEENEFECIKRQTRNDLSFAKPKFDEDYIIIKTLCKGEMGTVYLCMKFQDRKVYVVKKTNFFVSDTDYYKIENFYDCIDATPASPEFKFIQKYIDFWLEENQSKNTKSNTKNMYIVTDYCLGGDLKEFLNKIKESNFKCDKEFYYDIIFQMIVSLAFLHKLGYVHFDIKPSNYLVQENGQLLLSDFCLSMKEKDIINYSSEVFEGDSMFISPELFYKDKDIINNKTDVFSLGLSILQILTNIELPKNGLDWQYIRTIGIPQKYLKQIPYFDGDNEILKNLVISMTYHNSENRPSLENILNDKNNYSFLYERYQLLIKDKYEYKLDLNTLSNFKRDSYDFSSSIGAFKKRFVKRSNSMKFDGSYSEMEK